MFLKKIFICIVALLFVQIIVFAKQKFTPDRNILRKKMQGEKTTTSLLNVNNISSWIWYNGISAHDPFTDDQGIFYPRGTAGIIFQDGIIWGGFVNDPDTSLRVGGQTYTTGTTPGWIISTGNAVDPRDPGVRIYRIRRDWQSLSIDDSLVLKDAAELNGVDIEDVTQEMAQAVIDQYELDWHEWPGDLGAPYIDQNENNEWDAGIDLPGLKDADQVIWFVCNDLDNANAISLYGSPSIGLELQVTIWGYISSEALGQTVFRRYRLINKSGMAIDSMYIAQWSDPDIGDYTDDLAGCDPTINLGYGYNGESSDQQYQNFDLPPAAVGYCMLQGPIIPSPGDTAVYNFRTVLDHKNLPLTSFSYFAAGAAIDDPELGDYGGTLQWYNLLRGFIPTDDIEDPDSYIHGAGPNAGEPTKFPLNGDPVLGTGDVDGQGINLPPGDRRLVIATGPFKMEPGDEQEMITAVVGGIDSSYLLSIVKLKENIKDILEFKETLTTSIKQPAIKNPAQCQLMQNYPNPFNQMTTIVFYLIKQAKVELEIFDIQGKKVKSIIKNNTQAGEQKYVWDGCNDGGLSVSSGVYLYRIKAGDYIEVRKMLLIR